MENRVWENDLNSHKTLLNFAESTWNDLFKNSKICKLDAFIWSVFVTKTTKFQILIVRVGNLRVVIPHFKILKRDVLMVFKKKFGSTTFRSTLIPTNFEEFVQYLQGKLRAFQKSSKMYRKKWKFSIFCKMMRNALLIKIWK